ncbi:hypothetical protein GJ496_003870 [Pomphorhynchus laevis]|nr:hypothetical protein GJ496_003870 [Pomphorhynchus laevis]
MQWKRVYYMIALISMRSNLFKCALIKSNLYCLNKHKAYPDEIELACPMSSAVVNVFELRFILNSTCRSNIDNSFPAISPNSYKCQPKSIRGNNLLTCHGNKCSLSQIKSIKVCGYEANQVYALYDCIPVVLEKSIVWSRDNSTAAGHAKSPDKVHLKQLTCPNDFSILVTKALATLGPLNKIPICSLHEPFTIQTARSCCLTCHSCNVSMTAPGFRCKQRPVKNQHTIVNYSCIPRIDKFPNIQRYILCETVKIEVSSPTSGFIVSPNFPNSYPTNSQCNMSIESSSPMSFFLLEFDVVYPHSLIIDTTASDGKVLQLHAKDKLPRQVVKNMTSVTLTFISNYISSKGPVRIYFTNVQSFKGDVIQTPRQERSKPTLVQTSLLKIKNTTRSHKFVAFNFLQAPKPALIYGLSIASLALLCSSISLLITMLFCSRYRNPSKIVTFRQPDGKSSAAQESQSHLLIDYAQYEELLHPSMMLGTSPLTQRYCMHCCNQYRNSHGQQLSSRSSNFDTTMRKGISSFESFRNSSRKTADHLIC